MIDEEWRPVPSKPGMSASSLGRVLMPARLGVLLPNGGVRDYRTIPRLGTITKASKSARHLYYASYAPRYGNMKVHRLVCEAFHGPPPFPRAVVIHLNENALDNRPSNLRWGTQKENLNMPGFVAYCRGRTGANSPTVKARAKRSGLTTAAVFV